MAKMTRLTYRVWGLFLASTMGFAGQPHRWEPLPKCSQCIARTDILAPGIGIDLTPSYGTAAIRYLDGSVMDLGKVRALAIGVELKSNLLTLHRQKPLQTTWNSRPV